MERRRQLQHQRRGTPNDVVALCTAYSERLKVREERGRRDGDGRGWAKADAAKLPSCFWCPPSLLFTMRKHALRTSEFAPSPNHPTHTHALPAVSPHSGYPLWPLGCHDGYLRERAGRLLLAGKHARLVVLVSPSASSRPNSAQRDRWNLSFFPQHIITSRENQPTNHCTRSYEAFSLPFIKGRLTRVAKGTDVFRVLGFAHFSFVSVKPDQHNSSKHPYLAISATTSSWP